MKNVVSITAFILLVLAVVALLAVIAFSEGIRQAEWIELESASWACFGLAVLATILGWASFGRPLGKTTAVLGTVIVIGFLVQVARHDDSVKPFEPDRIAPAQE